MEDNIEYMETIRDDVEIIPEADEEEEIATPEEMKEEAVKRLKKLGVYTPAVKEFVEEGRIFVSEPPLGGLYYYDDDAPELFEKMREHEKKFGCMAYLVVRAFTNFGKLDTWLTVSKYKDEWDYDNEDIDDGMVMGYTYNVDDPICSDPGCIGYKSIGGGVIRVF